MKQIIAATAFIALSLAGCAPTGAPNVAANDPERAARTASPAALNARIAYFARANGVPESLVHRSIQRESGYNPAARRGPYWGLMQIRYDTARGMGYSGSPSGLLDADTNMQYAVPYLANAYRVAGGDERRAIALFASGYYYEAKRKGMLGELRAARSAGE